MGGNGLANSISDSPVTYAGGGGGKGVGNGAGSLGGSGGGGQGGTAVAGTANTGGGGGGSNGTGGPPGGTGGSGVVVIRAPGNVGIGASPGANTITTLPAPAGGCKVATFTVSGILTT